jgi:hypothetical protein
MSNAEQRRLQEADSGGAPWRRWGPYLSERQWAIVREDNTRGDDTWGAFTHDQARSRAYRPINMMLIRALLNLRQAATAPQPAEAPQ